uniref:CC domain-containing protein n=1 Tax=Strongyloides papillosus TaxID=174720 RepID=A0A0N5C784_STREA
MKILLTLEIFLLYNYILSISPQFLGSNFLSVLRGYSSDMCRYISCSYGSYCMNGVCMNSQNNLLGYGSGSLGSMGGFNSLNGLGGIGTMDTLNANKVCTDVDDCYSGQSCQGGRCMYTGYGQTSNALATGIGETISGVRPCQMVQDCLNTEICVNGFCSKSNVAYAGSQETFTTQSCSSGAPCPIGYYCINGICERNLLHSTSPCALGSSCQIGYTCQLGRCLPTTAIGK